jgi:hypothetical protein
MATSTTAAAALPPRILTREGTFIDDSWTVLDSAAEARADGPALLPLVDYLAQPQPTTHGVWLAPTDNAATLEAHLATLPLIAVRFLRSATGAATQSPRCCAEADTAAICARSAKCSSTSCTCCGGSGSPPSHCARTRRSKTL